MIEKTADLLLANAKQNKKGNKGKEKEVLGDLADGLEGEVLAHRWLGGYSVLIFQNVGYYLEVYKSKVSPRYVNQSCSIDR